MTDFYDSALGTSQSDEAVKKEAATSWESLLPTQLSVKRADGTTVPIPYKQSELDAAQKQWSTMRAQQREQSAAEAPPMPYWQLAQDPNFKSQAYDNRIQAYESWKRTDAPRLLQGYPEEEAANLIKNLDAQFRKDFPKPEGGGIVDGTRDMAAGFVGSALRGIGDVAAIRGADNAVARGLYGAGQWVDDLKTDAQKDRELGHRQRMAAAESPWEEGVEAASNIVSNSGQTAIELVGGMVPILGAAAAGSYFSGGTAAPALAAAVVGGLQAGGGARKAHYDNVNAMTLDEIKQNARARRMLDQGLSLEQVKQELSTEVTTGTIVAGLAGLATSWGPGAMLARRTGIVALGGRAAMAGEAAALGVADAVGEVAGQNIDRMGYDPNAVWYDGVSEAVIHGALLGGALGGALHSKGAAAQARERKALIDFDRQMADPQMHQRVTEQFYTDTAAQGEAVLAAVKSGSKDVEAQLNRLLDRDYIRQPENTPEGAYVRSLVEQPVAPLRDLAAIAQKVLTDPEVSAARRGAALNMLVRAEEKAAAPVLEAVNTEAMRIAKETPLDRPDEVFSRALQTLFEQDAGLVRGTLAYKRAAEDFVKASGYSERMRGMLERQVSQVLHGDGERETQLRVEEFNRFVEEFSAGRKLRTPEEVAASLPVIRKEAGLPAVRLEDYAARSDLPQWARDSARREQPDGTREPASQLRADAGGTAQNNVGATAPRRLGGTRSDITGVDSAGTARPTAPSAGSGAVAPAGNDGAAPNNSQNAQVDAVRRLGARTSDAGGAADAGRVGGQPAAAEPVRQVPPEQGAEQTAAGRGGQAEGVGRRLRKDAASDRPDEGPQSSGQQRDDTSSLRDAEGFTAALADLPESNVAQRVLSLDDAKSLSYRVAELSDGDRRTLQDGVTKAYSEGLAPEWMVDDLPSAATYMAMAKEHKLPIWTRASIKVRGVVNKLMKGISVAAAAIVGISMAVFSPNLATDARASTGLATYTLSGNIEPVGSKKATAVNEAVQFLGDSGGKNYAIVDRDSGRMYTMMPDGEVLDAVPAFVGKVPADADTLTLRQISSDGASIREDGQIAVVRTTASPEVIKVSSGIRALHGLDESSRVYITSESPLPEGSRVGVVERDSRAPSDLRPPMEVPVPEQAQVEGLPPARGATEALIPEDTSAPLSHDNPPTRWRGEETGEIYEFAADDMAGRLDAVDDYTARSVGAGGEIAGAISLIGGVASGAGPVYRGRRRRDNRKRISPEEEVTASSGGVPTDEARLAASPLLRRLGPKSKEAVDKARERYIKAMRSVEDMASPEASDSKLKIFGKNFANRAIEAEKRLVRGSAPRNVDNYSERLDLIMNGVLPRSDTRLEGMRKGWEKFIDGMTFMYSYFRDSLGIPDMEAIHRRSRNQYKVIARDVETQKEKLFLQLSKNAKKLRLNEQTYMALVGEYMGYKGAITGNERLYKKMVEQDKRASEELAMLDASEGADDPMQNEYRISMREKLVQQRDEAASFIDGYLNYNDTIRQPGLMDPTLVKRARHARFAANLTTAEANHFLGVMEKKFADKFPTLVQDAEAAWAMHSDMRRKAYEEGLYTDAEYNEWIQDKFYVPETGDAVPLRSAIAYETRAGIKENERVGRTTNPENGLVTTLRQIDDMAYMRGMSEFHNRLAQLGEENGRIFSRDYEEGVAEGLNIRAVIQTPEGPQVVRKNILLMDADGYMDEGAQAALTGANVGKMSDSKLLDMSRRYVGMMSWLVTSGKASFGMINAMRDTFETVGNIVSQDLAGGMQGTAGQQALTASGLTARAVKNLPNALRASFIGMRQTEDARMGAQALSGFIEKMAGFAGGENLSSFINDRNELHSLGGISTRTRAMSEDFSRTAGSIAKMTGMRGQLRKFLNAVEWWNRGFEESAKVAVFRALKEQGVNPQRASDAILQSMDFNQRGAGSQILAAIYPFYNTRMVGLSNVMKSLGSRRGQAVFAAQILSGLALIEMARAAGGGDDDILGNKTDNLSGASIQRAIPLWTGDSFIKIPVPYGTGFLAWNMAVAMDRKARGVWTASDAAAHIFESGLEEGSLFGSPPPADIRDDTGWFIARTMMPEVLKRFANVVADKNDFGAKLTTPFPDKNLSMAYQGKASTPAFWKEMTAYLHEASGGNLDMAPEALAQYMSILIPDMEQIINAADKKEDAGSGVLAGLNVVLGGSRLSGRPKNPLQQAFYNRYNKYLATVRRAQSTYGRVPTAKDSGIKDAGRRVKAWAFENNVPDDIAKEVEAVYVYEAANRKKNSDSVETQTDFLRTVREHENANR